MSHPKVTAEQVEDAVKRAGIIRIDHHACSLCGYMTHYLAKNGFLFFNPGCFCVFRLPVQRTWQDAADLINLQSNEDARIKLIVAFGLKRDWADVAISNRKDAYDMF